MYMVWKWTERFFGKEGWYFEILVLAIIYLLIFGKGERKRFLIPSLTVTLFVLNPLTSKLVKLEHS